MSVLIIIEKVHFRLMGISSYQLLTNRKHKIYLAIEIQHQEKNLNKVVNLKKKPIHIVTLKIRRNH